MSRQWTAELGDKARVHEIYLVTHKATPLSKNGKPYLSLTLTDRTGNMDARVWENVEKMGARFEEGDFVRVKGRVVLYMERLQLHVASLERVAHEELDVADYLPRSTASPQQLMAELRSLLSSVENPHLRRLIDEVLADQGFMDAFGRLPAGKSIHHARLGGLAEHSLSLCRLVDAICASYRTAYPNLLDRDLLITAAFLHDAGKTRELCADHKFEYTDVGRLVGHIVLGYEYVAHLLGRLDGFPEDLARHLLHLLLSHHGELDHGSPKRPKTPEAWVLHFADLLDCRVDHTAEILSAVVPGGWSPYQRLHDRYFWKGHLRDSSGQTEATDTPSDDDATEESGPDGVSSLPGRRQ